MPFATHHLPLGEAERAYDVLAVAAETHALKIVLEAATVEQELAADRGAAVAG